MPRARYFMVQRVSIALVLLLFAAVLRAQVPNVRLNEAATTIREVGRALIVRSPEDAKRYNPDFEREQTQKLTKALDSYVSATLEGKPDVTARDVRAGLKAVYDPWTEWGDMVDAPQAWRVSLKGQQFLVVALLLNRNGQGAPRSKALLEAFALRDGKGQVVSSTGDTFDGHGLFAREMTSHVPGESWFLVYGKRFADSGARSEVVLYSFDGTQFQTKWSRSELSALRLNVDGDTLDLNYWTPGPASVRKPVHERYRLTEKGVVAQENAPPQE
jgi:hypothetical protein